MTVGSATGPSDYDAILLASFGGPEGPDDVMPFLRNVTAGRGVPDERLAGVAEHYLAFGGISPINAQNRALQSALTAELDRRGVRIPVLWGNRNWQPNLADTLRGAAAAGFRRLLAVTTSAYSSYSSCRQYREDFAAALVDAGLVGSMTIDKVRPYYDHPGFLQPFVDGIAAALTAADDAGIAAAAIRVVFTTHSIPDAMAEASGTSDDGRLYVAQHEAGCAEVMRRLAAAARGSAPQWQLAYQSRSGSPRTPWLEPDINDVITTLSSHGVRGVIVVPIGFISDHMEVRWDLDTEAAETAASCGMWFSRVATPGTAPAFVRGLVDLIAERLDPSRRPAVSTTALPARPRTCPPGCCTPRHRRPTVAGADSRQDWAGTTVTPELLAASGIEGNMLP